MIHLHTSVIIKIFLNGPTYFLSLEIEFYWTEIFSMIATCVFTLKCSVLCAKIMCNYAHLAQKHIMYLNTFSVFVFFVAHFCLQWLSLCRTELKYIAYVKLNENISEYSALDKLFTLKISVPCGIEITYKWHLRYYSFTFLYTWTVEIYTALSLRPFYGRDIQLTIILYTIQWIY